ncbi:MAG: phosphopantetheine-binding protein [Bacillota bacterium]
MELRSLSNNEIESVVIKLSSVLGCGILPENQIQADSKLIQIGFDSIRYMELVVLLEEELNIELPDEILEISPDTRLSDLVSAISGVEKN